MHSLPTSLRDFAVIDLTTLQTISTIGGTIYRFNRVVLFEDSGQRRLLAFCKAVSPEPADYNLFF
mgnify:CR=1 FL=1